MKKIILSLIIGVLLIGCGKAKPPVYPLDYDKSKTIAPMKDGKLHGVREAYRGNGNIILLTSYINGEKDGVEKRYNRYNKLSSEISFKKGKRDGISKEWDFSRDKITSYSVTPYKNGKKNGLQKDYYANGKISSKIPYVDDKIDGVYKSWQRDGTLRKLIPYKNGKREGTVKYFEDGQLSYIGAYTNDKQYGIHKSYFRGKIEEAVPYVDGILEGTGDIYDEEGSLKYTLVWKNGVEGKTTYSKKEKQRRAKAQKKVIKKSKTNVVELKCGWEDNHPSMSESSRKTAIARGKGEGTALGYQMRNNTISTSRLEASNYCTQNVNAEALSCRYAKVYLSGCMSKFGY